MRSKHTLSIAEKIAARGNLNVDELAAWSGFCRAKIYDEIRQGRLKTFKSGKSRRATAQEALRWQAASSGECA